MNKNLSYKEYIKQHERQRREYAQKRGFDYNSYYHVKPALEDEEEVPQEEMAADKPAASDTGSEKRDEFLRSLNRRFHRSETEDELFEDDGDLPESEDSFDDEPEEALEENEYSKEDADEDDDI